MISLDSDNTINNIIKYIKIHIIKNYFIYNIKCFDDFICLALNKGIKNTYDDNNNINFTFKKDKNMNYYSSLINLDKIKIYFSNNNIKNYEYIINNNTYENIDFFYFERT